MAAKYFSKLTDEAAIDLEEIIEWYENQKTGLGSSFFEEYIKIENQIIQFPKSGSIYFQPFRRILFSKFPFVVYYSLDESFQEISILAVLHQRRSSDYIKRRL